MSGRAYCTECWADVMIRRGKLIKHSRGKHAIGWKRLASNKDCVGSYQPADVPYDIKWPSTSALEELWFYESKREWSHQYEALFVRPCYARIDRVVFDEPIPRRR